MGSKGPSPSVQMQQINHMFDLGMARISNERMQAMQSYLLGTQQINAMKDISEDKNDTAVQIARMNFAAQSKANRLETKVALRELDVREHEAVLEAQSANRVDTTNFLT